MFLFIPLHPSITNVRRIQRNSIFFTFWSGRTAWFYLFRWVIWSFHLIGNHQKLSETGRHGELFCFFSKQKQSLNTVSIKTSLCSIHDTVVFRNNIEVITYSYGRGNTSVYFWSPYFFFPGFLFPVTQKCQSVDLVLIFLLASSLSIISVFILGQISNLKRDLNDSKSFFFKAEFLDQTVEVWWLKPFFSL